MEEVCWSSKDDLGYKTYNATGFDNEAFPREKDARGRNELISVRQPVFAWSINVRKRG